MENCIFCQIASGASPCHKIYEDDRAIAFADINPVAEGHSLIIPRKHAASLYEIEPDDLAGVHWASQKVVHAMRRAYNCLGVVVLQLNGRDVNQLVMHYHIHLVPRLPGAPPLPVSGWGARPGDPEILRRTAARIAAAIEST